MIYKIRTYSGMPSKFKFANYEGELTEGDAVYISSDPDVLYVIQGRTSAWAPFIPQIINVEESAPGSGGSGPRGYQGYQGPKGDQGSIGPAGQQGAAGTPSTVAGPQGAVGPQGAAGGGSGTGPQGATGSQGATGAQGVVGAQGVQGPAGGGSSNSTSYDTRQYSIATISDARLNSLLNKYGGIWKRPLGWEGEFAETTIKSILSLNSHILNSQYIQADDGSNIDITKSQILLDYCFDFNIPIDSKYKVGSFKYIVFKPLTYWDHTRQPMKIHLIGLKSNELNSFENTKDGTQISSALSIIGTTGYSYYAQSFDAILLDSITISQTYIESDGSIGYLGTSVHDIFSNGHFKSDYISQNIEIDLTDVIGICVIFEALDIGTFPNLINKIIDTSIRDNLYSELGNGGADTTGHILYTLIK